MSSVILCMHAQSCLTLCDHGLYVARQAPLFMGFSRQEYWSRLPFPPPGDLLDLGIKPPSLKSPELAAGFFTTSTTYISRKLVMNPRLLKYSLVYAPYISSGTCVSVFPMGVMLDALDRGFSFNDS